MNFLVLLISISISALAQVKETRSVKNEFVRREGDPQQIEISVISDDKASEIFAAMKNDKTIPYQFPYLGCEARATMQTQIAALRDVIMGKIFVEGELQALTQDEKYPYAKWNWSVAPVAYVKNAKGARVMMVFDPSIAEKPLSIDEWRRKILVVSQDGVTPKIKEEYFGSRHEYYPKSVNKELTRALVIQRSIDDNQYYMSYVNRVDDFVRLKCREAKHTASASCEKLLKRREELYAK